MRTMDSDSRPGFYSALAAHVRAEMTGIIARCTTSGLKTTHSLVSLPLGRDFWVTGTLLGGGGGKAKGQVTEASVEGSYTLPLYRPRDTVEALHNGLEGR
jgi:hypothetical protein